MRGKRQVSLLEEFQMDYVHALPSRRKGIVPSAYILVASPRDFLPQSAICRGRGSNVTLEEPDTVSGR